MGRLFIESLNGPKIFKCKCCKVDSASHDDIISKDFQGRYGRAYLFKNVIQFLPLPPSLHSCQQILGWRYEKAYEESEKYKEGLFILEKERMLKEGW